MINEWTNKETDSYWITSDLLCTIVSLGISQDWTIERNTEICDFVRRIGHCRYL